MRTPKQEIDKRYETRHKEERRQRHKVWGTSVRREYAEEIDDFLTKNGYTKVQLIAAGYKALQEEVIKKK
jgi:hypothetical protein